MTLLALSVLALVGCQTGALSKQSPGAAASPSPLPSPSPSRPAVPATSLRITGALTASSDPSAAENACVYGQPFAGEVRMSTPQMTLADGQAIAIVLFIAPSVGTYAATSAAGNGQPIVRAQRTTRPGGGGDSGDWLATSGTLTVSQATNLGNRSVYGVVAGGVDARLAWANGTQAITLQGTWGCVIDPVANGS